ncbi:Poly(A) polymerase predicted RNA binding domain [Musa troglodytarum]|nr:Poly(A) polymerase predicted RNA binding domain [Musa troglodytarum]
MAYALPGERRITVPPPPPPVCLVDPGTLILPPPPPVAYLVPLGAVFVQNPVLVPRNHSLVSPPVILRLNPAFLMQMDEQRTRSLLQFMAQEGLEPSPEEEMRRNTAIDQLKQIVLAWIKKVAWQRHLPKDVIADASATVLTYGSYGLGVHGPESDIDALCVGPYFVTLEEDFFIVLHSMLESQTEISEIHCVKSAKVPLMRFKFNGISIDFPYARLPAISVPEILLTADNDDELQEWVGWVKSRIRGLLLKLEMVQEYCDPNPTENVDHNITEPNIIFYWGLSPKGNTFINIGSLKKDFMKSINTDQFADDNHTHCKLALLIVQYSQLPKSLRLDAGSAKGSKPCGKILDNNYLQKPVDSQYLPQYFVGYVANEQHRAAAG